LNEKLAIQKIKKGHNVVPKSPHKKNNSVLGKKELEKIDQNNNTHQMQAPQSSTASGVLPTGISEISKKEASGFSTYSNYVSQNNLKKEELQKKNSIKIFKENSKEELKTFRKSPRMSAVVYGTFGKTVESDTFGQSDLSSARQKSQSTFEKLYKDNEKRLASQEKRELELEEQELKSCTFSPILSATNKFNQSRENIDLRPAYEKLHELHSSRMSAIEKKKKDKEIEDSKNRQFKANRKISHLNYPTTTKNIANNKQNDKNDKNEAFTRLYKQDKIYRENKKKLEKQIMVEQGIKFMPNLNNYSLNIADDGTTIVERNQTFWKKKQENITTKAAEIPKECTFKPMIVPRKQEPAPKPPKNPIKQKMQSEVGQRLFKYYEHYEQRKAKLKEQLNC